MNIQTIEPYVIFRCIAGSRAYGTNNENSDTDIRGIFRMPQDAFLGLTDPIQQVSDDKQDITYWELRRYFELALDCNPNIIEILWSPNDCILECSPVMAELVKHRNLFISQKAKHTFGGYAYAQCKRAKGQNKWVNNEKPETPPNKLDFCWFIDVQDYAEDYAYGNVERLVERGVFPVRPSKVTEVPLDLSKHRVAKLEHTENIYRLYRNGDGVFRGPSQQLVCDSISKEDEWHDFCGLLTFNEQEYDREMKDWKNYWEWKKNRNEARYRTMEAGEIDYDSKNISHCMRLLFSGINIMRHGEPIVRFEGEQLQLLRDIRNGKFSYEEVMTMVEEKMAELDGIETTIPHSVNAKQLDKLYRDLCVM